MPELNFQITGVEAGTQGLTPLLQFKLQITTTPASEPIQGLLLNAQLQIQSPQRTYSEQEKEQLVDLFGRPEQWGRTLRNRLWTHCNATVGAFTGSTQTVLPVPCSFDLNIASVKYLYGLTTGEVPLLFLYSGSLFYATGDGRLQVERISWSKECVYSMPVHTWRQLMEQHYPNCGWLYLQRDIFDQLYAYKRRHGLATWEEVISRLLPAEAGAAPEATGERLPQSEVVGVPA